VGGGRGPSEKKKRIGTSARERGHGGHKVGDFLYKGKRKIWGKENWGTMGKKKKVN